MNDMGDCDMKLAKKFLSIVLIITLLLTVVGCEDESWQYTFRQDRSNVQKVEICSFKYQDRKEISEPLVSFQGDDADAILDDIAALTCYKLGLLHNSRGFGQIIICIHYLNQEIEVIGTENNGWVDANGDWHIEPTHIRFPDLRPLLAKYVDSKVLAGIMSDFR